MYLKRRLLLLIPVLLVFVAACLHSSAAKDYRAPVSTQAPAVRNFLGLHTTLEELRRLNDGQVQLITSYSADDPELWGHTVPVTFKITPAVKPFLGKPFIQWPLSDVVYQTLTYQVPQSVHQLTILHKVEYSKGAIFKFDRIATSDLPLSRVKGSQYVQIKKATVLPVEGSTIKHLLQVELETNVNFEIADVDMFYAGMDRPVQKLTREGPRHVTLLFEFKGNPADRLQLTIDKTERVSTWLKWENVEISTNR